jgi:hypothetical protein
MESEGQCRPRPVEPRLKSPGDLHEDRNIVIHAGGLRDEALPDRRPGEVYCVFSGSSEGANLGRMGIGAEAPGRRNMPRIAGLALAALMVLGFAVPAAASENSKHDRDNSTLFATGLAPTAVPGGNRVLLAIDVERGTTTVIGPAVGSLAPNSLALAITPDGTAAYTIANSFSAAAAQLAKIDLATGAQTLVGRPIGADLKIMGMTFSPDGVLYAAGDFVTTSPTFNSLYTIDLRTGAPTRVGSLGAGPNATDYIMSFVFDSHGNMYGASPKALYKIHLPDAEGGEARTQEAGQGAQALATKVVGFIGSAQVMGIAIGEDGNFYAADFVPAPTRSTIYGLNVETGFLTPLFKTGIANVHNIAFVPERQRGHHE